MACWCTDVGSQQSLLAVFAFDPTTLPKGPANAISYNKKPPKKVRLSEERRAAGAMRQQKHCTAFLRN